MSVVTTRAEANESCEASTARSTPFKKTQILDESTVSVILVKNRLNDHARKGSLEGAIDDLPFFLREYNNSANLHQNCIRFAASRKEGQKYYELFVAFHIAYAHYITTYTEMCKDMLLRKCQKIVEDCGGPSNPNLAANKRAAAFTCDRVLRSASKRRPIGNNQLQPFQTKTAIVKPMMPKQWPTGDSVGANTHSRGIVVVDVDENTTTFLGTAMVEVMNADAFCADMRCLCDAGSALNLITDETVRRLRLEKSPIEIELSIGGIGGKRSVVADGWVRVQLAPHYGELAQVEVVLYVVRHISDELPIRRFATDWLHRDMAGELADINFNCPGPIEAVLGVNVWASIIQPEIRTFSDNICAQRTRFGWVMFGTLRPPNDTHHINRLRGSVAAAADAFAKTTRDLTKLWKRETITNTHLCKIEYANYPTVHSSLHYCPLSDESKEVGGFFRPTREDAKNMFAQLERRLSGNPEAKLEYINFMQDCIGSGRMRLTQAEDKRSHYVPHHCVVMSRKFRHIFNAPHPVRNAVQMIGERLHDDWPMQLLKFRSFKVALTARLVQKYQNGPHTRNRNNPRIFWRESPDDDLLSYELPIETDLHAPYCAVRAVRRCALDKQTEFPLGSYQLLNCCFMDRYFGGADTQSEAHATVAQLHKLLDRGGFVPMEFCSSADNVVQVNADTTHRGICCEDDDVSLGLHWLPVDDCFAYRVNLIRGNSPRTSREMIAELERLYDPCGLIAPVIITAKLLALEICKVGDTDVTDAWDRQIFDPEILAKWDALMADLLYLNDIKVPRWLAMGTNRGTMLIGFCSASDVAHAAVVYARTQLYNEQSNEGDTVVTTLMQSDAQIALAVCDYTQNEMHLIAAQQLAELMTAIEKCFDHQIIGKHYWTGSMATVRQIRDDSLHEAIFSNAYLNIIRATTNRKEWHYVTNMYDNPAALATTANNQFFQNQTLWYNGPNFIRRNEYGREMDQHSWP